MNSISAKSSENQLQGVLCPKQTSESIETAGSLAMNSTSLFQTNVYDVFSSSNPFAVDYSQYSDSGDSAAYNGGFLSEFSSAVSTLSSNGGFSDSSSASGAGFSGASCGFSGGCSSGGFTSVC